MAKKTPKKTNVSLVDTIVKGIQEKKGTNICVIDLTKVLNAYSDYFVICTGSSEPNVQAISNSVEELTFDLLQDKPSHIEGYREGNWILLDYFDTMVHIFKSDERDFYNLEKLWADAEVTYIPDNKEI